MSYYYFEMVLAGIILLTTMAGIGITLMIRRRREGKVELESSEQQEDKSNEN